MPFATEHATPHAPQFAGSLDSLTQTPPQLEYPASQAIPHVPPAQVARPWADDGQARPHAPQLFGSLAPTLTHEPAPQSVKPAVQAYPQLTPLHVAWLFPGTGHAVHEAPHVLTESLRTHAPPHR